MRLRRNRGDSRDLAVAVSVLVTVAVLLALWLAQVVPEMTRLAAVTNANEQRIAASHRKNQGPVVKLNAAAAAAAATSAVSSGSRANRRRNRRSGSSA
ncbi:hypothetical protein NFJ02_30g78490 [Pycnococcus provasolii]